MEASSSAMSASLGMTYIGLGGRDTVNSLLEEWGGGTPSIRYTVNSLYIGEGTVNSLGWHLGSG